MDKVPAEAEPYIKQMHI